MSAIRLKKMGSLIFAGGLAIYPSLNGWAADESQPNLQDMQIAGRVLGFQDTAPTGTLIVAVVYDGADQRSRAEAAEVAALLGNGLTVGVVVMRPYLVEQSQLASARSYDAVVSAAKVDGNLLKAALRQRRVPCITTHLLQVEQGSCTVAVRSVPIVSITLSEANAEYVGVHFATAFRMMVREI